LGDQRSGGFFSGQKTLKFFGYRYTCCSGGSTAPMTRTIEQQIAEAEAITSSTYGQLTGVTGARDKQTPLRFVF